VRYAALTLWASTACIGLYLLVTLLVRGGVRRQPTKVTRYPVVLVAGHPVLSLAGLGLWSTYLATGRVGYGWAAFGVLCASALLGFALLTRRLTGQGGRHAREGAGQSGLWVVVLHGLGGLATFVLVLITATLMSRG
jgi:hypothetical protein